MSQATARGISLCPTAALPPARPDAIFGDDFPEHVRHMGICEVLSASLSPWQRAYIERVIGSVRRQCIDHMIVSTKGRAGATSNSPARNGIRRSATPRRPTAPPLRTTGCLKVPESNQPACCAPLRFATPCRNSAADGCAAADLFHQIEAELSVCLEE